MPESAESEIDVLFQQTDELGRLLGKLKEPFRDDRIAELLARCPKSDADTSDEIDPTIYWKLKAVLRTPFPTADTRTRLWEALQRIDRLLQQRTDENTNRHSVPLGSVDNEKREAERGLLRVRLSFRLFVWGGLEGGELGKALRLYQLVENDPSDHDSWAALAQEMQRLWGKTLGADMKKTSDLRKKINLSRIIYPLDREHSDGTEKSDRYPAAMQRMQQINDAKTFIKQLID